ncbi:MAG TPA: glyoxalase [Micromonosporaceae bacterium]|nr:glyoxalase [Micromonosporaceae bacterium]
MTPQLNAIGIAVSDLDRAMAFYAQLGVHFKADGNSGHAECELGGMRLMLDTYETVQSFIPGWAPPTGSARVAFAFQFDAPAQVDAKYAELVDAGAKSQKPPFDAPWGQRYATILDPDGNGIDFYAAL